MVSLIAAKAYFFCLDTIKKNQDKGDAATLKAMLPARPLCRVGQRTFSYLFESFIEILHPYLF